MLALLEAGRRLGRRPAGDSDAAPTGTGVVEGAVFALLGLLLAFQFGGAAARLDARRQLAVQEANALGTAYLRLDLLAADRQSPLRELFRQYTDARLRALDAMPDLAAVEAEFAVARKLQGEIWSRAVAACQKESGTAATLLLLPALNDMIDVTTSRVVAGRTHASPLVVVFLFGVALTSAGLAGRAMAPAKERPVMHMILFAAVTAATVYVILDMEFPRLGFIRIGAPDQALREARQSMN
jgi:hypothetical protein